ncbi:MAG TPA: hypothetical protein VMR52_10220 [Dehalococcoidia bacterium]|nr:hypothetical protein [Dehalococcoidia bacterium]
MPTKVDKIQDDGLRATMADAQDALRTGDYKKVVELTGDAYIELLRRKPEMLQGPQQFMSIMFFPRLGAHVQLNSAGEPELIWDREKFIFSEAVMYYEFAVDNLIKHGI